MANRAIIGALTLAWVSAGGGFASADNGSIPATKLTRIVMPDSVLADLLAGNTRYLEGRMQSNNLLAARARTC